MITHRLWAEDGGELAFWGAWLLPTATTGVQTGRLSMALKVWKGISERKLQLPSVQRSGGSCSFRRKPF